MPRIHRLSRVDFARIARTKGQRVHGRYFSLLGAPLPGAPKPKFACVISKKIAARANVRNAIDRRAREAARPILAKLAGEIAYVLYPKREAIDAHFRDTSADIESLFRALANKTRAKV